MVVGAVDKGISKIVHQVINMVLRRALPRNYRSPDRNEDENRFVISMMERVIECSETCLFRDLQNRPRDCPKAA